MSAAKEFKSTTVSRASSIEEVADFWDTHSLDDHWDQTREAAFQVRAPHRRRVTLDPEMYERIEALALARGLSLETLVNLWLAERLQGSKRKAGSPRPRS
jgi:CopG antitoxin of type II toxin-antitoxin system